MSDIGLSTSNEDMDAFGLLPDGRLLVSTLGNVSVTGASGADEDLLAFTPTALGSTTGGTWAMYWDGSVNGFSGEDTDSLSVILEFAIPPLFTVYCPKGPFTVHCPKGPFTVSC